ncbi:hypothetical protein BT93_L2896 [Corymbia citriodora subsp. variegata]|uniref:Uncharacterized protein n=1 Tax=Corymbia citriodora subsp. variegata TaxID=360336 RepID=A0A8T0CNU6_CORYI|nr:hypothetical protein BT93_L2896 [Corymbia citriodora subsp. variegata]
MATALLPYGPLAVRAMSSSSAKHKPGPAGRRSPSSDNKWLAPIFGFSSEPGYIDSAADGKVAYPSRKADLEGSGSSLSAAAKPGRPRPDPIRFTEEKARLLRLMTSDHAASLHDAMYHSAIASRLASDFGNRTDL